MNTNKYYDKYKRDERSKAFYKSKEWRTLREYIIQRDNGLCQHCIKKNMLKPAAIVHHIVEIKEDWSRRLDADNLESVCYSCHNKTHGTKKDEPMRKIRVVKG